MLSALFAATLAAPQRPYAFLDSPTRIVAPLANPLPTDRLSGSATVMVNGVARRVVRIRPGGEPQAPRTLPRTPGRVVLAGTLQSVTGGREWDPDGESTQMVEEAPGVFGLSVRLPAGIYEYKVARNGGWGENWGVGFEAGGGNLRLSVPEGGRLVRFVVDFNQKLIKNSIEHPSEVAAPKEPTHKPGEAKEAVYPVGLIDLAEPIRADEVDETIELEFAGVKQRVVAREVLDRPEFRFDGPLGASYTRASTMFRVWSPVSSSAEVLLFDRPTGGAATRVRMQRTPSGVWWAKVPGDLHQRFYQYRFESYGERRTTQDIYSFAAGRDQQRSMVVDLSRTNPEGWPSKPALRHQSKVDSVVYELHVRDFTVDPSSGVPAPLRGKYSGLSYPGSTVPRTEFPTALDYLKRLGVTDVHLLPVQSFLSGPNEYTWGYATNLFNVPEETYAANLNDPVGVIREFKSMVRDMHGAGLRVVLDVVYNHTWPPEGNGSAFWQTVPFYYFRTNLMGDVLNESGVGNAMHDERPMVSKFVRDSLLYWQREYLIDGFRFDLLGMHAPSSVRDWSTALHRARPDVLLYGEPWTGGGPTRFPFGAQRGMHMAAFNDRFRGLFRGDLDGDAPGFLTGRDVDLAAFRRAVTGTTGPDGEVGSPIETINYVSAHDNLTLRDRLARSLPADPKLLSASTRLAHAMVLLSQGVPFLEGGAEIGRTKGGNRNSYNAGDAVNQYDWERAVHFADDMEYVRGLIALRKAHPVFRLRTSNEIQRRVGVEKVGPSLFIVSLSGTDLAGAMSEYRVMVNGSFEPKPVPPVPGGGWQVLADAHRSGTKAQYAHDPAQTMPPLSVLVLGR